jgi:class 3 adenylate cyclase
MTGSVAPAVRIAAVLFADVVGFSTFTDRQVESFVRGFLTDIADLVARTEHRPTYANTWGDALYFQFDGVRPAGLFALELTELIGGTDWSARGLPASLSLRVGLHAGPMFAFRDPLTGADCYWGRHVTRAARIEPVTPPGEVYASREFAALSALDRSAGFACEPVGVVDLAKAYGEARLYHVTRSRRLTP